MIPIKKIVLELALIFTIQSYTQSKERIIFTKNREIHCMNIDGTGLKQLTDFKMPGHTPISLSASTTKKGKIAFIYDPVNHGYMSTYIMNANGTNIKRISKEPKSGKSSTWGTTVSPDGKYYVFESKWSNNVEIYRMNADGSNVINISKSIKDDAFPKWSPDSQQIIYTTKNTKSGWDIIATDLAGNKKKVLIHSKEEIRNVAYSKDGKLIAYCVAKSNSSDLMLADANGSNIRKLKTIAQYSNVSFSPNNKSITFVSKNNKITIMKLEGTGYKELTTGRRPVWSFN
ncbi:WD40 repeat protein [Aquimarina sp. MAR_2010_214]|uniref:TolB family protein n=1 Tax=Aquimarina sp. MAR_2010_214 TaxID=1250026 RepID=UPI000C707425|nr:DUF5050 domain-containing protein [Aquimarina sp. MAR_2010_214]PKV52569.1 WD40 repeat protein [Aquimarina sp. MAR_2010_214]